MPRKRIIDPEFWSDEEIGKWPVRARLFYIALWNFADDDGRLKANSAYLHAQIFPYDDPRSAKIAELKKICSTKVIWYNVKGSEYGYIKNFAKYQRIDRPTPSKLPPPNSTSTRRVIDDDSLLIEVKLKEKNISDESTNAVNLTDFLIKSLKINNPNIKIPKDISNWQHEADKLFRLDKRSFKEANEVLNWCQNDSFWKCNILSMAKFREKYDQLFIGMKEFNKRKNIDNEHTGMKQRADGSWYTPVQTWEEMNAIRLKETSKP